ncbi:RNA-guided endonuclease InsQ/TnpB family protein [Lactobacillus porci]|uniref:RNA-guided endonuclease InsQ/TnpB family protein n=1 Tax=Lactobacillus porci TaxID=2012477 RepID=UPI0039937375
MAIKGTKVYRLYPDATMSHVLDQWCDYRRYCYNKALETWNATYTEYRMTVSPEIIAELKKPKKERQFTKEQELFISNYYPTAALIQKKLTASKQSWEKQISSRILQQACADLGKSFKKFAKDKATKAKHGAGRPKFQSKKEKRQGFKLNQGVVLSAWNDHGRLTLPIPQSYKGEWHSIKISEPPEKAKMGTVSFYREHGRYYMAVPYTYENPSRVHAETGRKTGVDVNVSHFNDEDGAHYFLHKNGSGKWDKNIGAVKLDKIYRDIKHQQRIMARKLNENGRIAGRRSKSYQKARIKLQKLNERAHRMQDDAMHKYTTHLVKEYDAICIEDLDVKGMLMSHVASKGVHRALFGRFRDYLKYKCKSAGVKLVIANRFYPSTQRCAVCGNVKKDDEKITLSGNKKHGTKHNEYVCYNKKCPNCNKVVDRDVNAMMNLTFLIDHPKYNKAL